MTIDIETLTPPSNMFSLALCPLSNGDSLYTPDPNVDVHFATL
jgi:hypothetical protein